MVTNITNFGRSGLADWLMQRVTAVIMLAYTLCILGYFLTSNDISFLTWKAMFQGTAMRIFSFMALLSIAVHAWIGMWTVATDYIKPTGIRVAYHLVVILALFAYVVWGVQVLWGA